MKKKYSLASFTESNGFAGNTDVLIFLSNLFLFELLMEEDCSVNPKVLKILLLLKEYSDHKPLSSLSFFVWCGILAYILLLLSIILFLLVKVFFL